MPTDTAILSKLVKNLAERGAEPLRPLIDAYLLERDASPTRVRDWKVDMKPRLRPGGRYSPSSLCGCERAAAFKFVGMPGRRRLDPDLELIFEDGIWRHHKYQAMLADMQAVLGKERIRVISYEAGIEVPELYIAGNSDELVRVDGRKRVIDYKGINDQGFEWLFSHDEPRPEHVRQLIAYEKGHGVPRGSLFYENKNNQRTLIFTVEFDDALWYEVVEWIEENLDNINHERLPPMHPECVAGNMLWEKCVYSRHCYGHDTPVKIKRRMYKNFPGVDEAWEASKQLVEVD